MTRKIEALRDLLVDPFRDSNLTAKEREAARLAAFGYTSSEIAEKLGLKTGAVQNRIYFARLKLKVSKAGLTRLLMDQIERIVQ